MQLLLQTVNPDLPVIAIKGDSAFGFSGMEMETICRYKLNILVIVFNNGGIYKGNEKRVNINEPAPTQFSESIRYDMIIEGFGGKGYNVETADELQKSN